MKIIQINKSAYLIIEDVYHQAEIYQNWGLSHPQFQKLFVECFNTYGSKTEASTIASCIENGCEFTWFENYQASAAHGTSPGTTSSLISNAIERIRALP